MDSSVLEALRLDCAKGLLLAETKLAAGGSFEALKQEAEASAYKGCCGKSATDGELLVTCHTCMKGKTSCQCLECFGKVDHTGHKVIVAQVAGVCDCGDINSMIPSAFCDKHRGVLADPEAALLSPEIRERFPPVLLAVAKFAAENFGNQDGETCLQWFESMCAWGDGYIRLIVKAFLAGPIQEMVEKCLAGRTPLIERFFSFTTEMITDETLKLWIAKLLNDLMPKLRIACLKCTTGDSSQIKFYEQLSIQSIQLFTRAVVMREQILNSDLLRKLIDCEIEVHKEVLQYPNRRGMEGVFVILNLLSSLGEGFRFRAIARQIVFERDDLLAILFDYLENLQFQFLSKRHTSNVPRDEDPSEWFYATMNHTDFLSTGLTVAVKSIREACDLSSESQDEPTYAPLDDANLAKLEKLLCYARDRYKAWDDSHQYGLNALADEYSIGLPMDRCVMGIINTIIGFHRLSGDVVLKMMKMDSFWLFVKHQMTLLAALHYRTAFHTQEVERVVTKKIIRENLCRGLYVSLYQNLMLYRAFNDHPEQFVSQVINAWGLKKWLDSNGSENEENMDINIALVMILRFFVQSMSDYFDEMTYDADAFSRRAVIHWLQDVGMGTSQALASDMSDDPMACMAFLHDVGVPVVIDGEKRYKLKPEYFDEATPFWIITPYGQFLKKLATAPGKTVSLLPLPKCASKDGKNANRFAITQEFADFITHVLEIMNKEPELYTEATYLCVMAAIQMAVIVGSDFNNQTLTTSLVKSDSLRVFTKNRQILAPLASLLEFIMYKDNNVSDYVGALRTEALAELEKGQTRKARPNMKAIMDSFRAKQAACAQQFVDELAQVEQEDEDEHAMRCVHCHEAITNEDCYGMFWACGSLDICAHYCHERCLRSGRLFWCPICQVIRPSFVPVLTRNSPPERIKLLQDAIAGSKNPCIFGNLLEDLTWVLNLDGTSEIGEAHRRLLQSLMIGLAEKKSEEDRYLVFACSLLSKGLSDETFDKERAEYGLDNEDDENICRMVWNLICDLDQRQDLAPKALVPGPVKDRALHFSDLPKQFSDLFINIDKETLVVFERSARHGLGGVCKCLHCGKICTIRGSEGSWGAHSRETQHVAYFVFSGNFASAVFVMNPLTEIAQSRAIYLTEYGDEDIGLNFGLPLVLSESRVNEVRRNFILGSYFRVRRDAFPAAFRL